MIKSFIPPSQAIGGFFELELAQREAYYPDAIALNSGRSSLEYILRKRNFTKIYIPIFTCSAIEEIIQKLNIHYVKYSINELMEPLLSEGSLGSSEVLLYTNYFGLQAKNINLLANKYPNLIIDNSQAFFDKPILSIDSFYSPRKFFGVPDGGYASMGNVSKNSLELKESLSHQRFAHLVLRHDLSAQEAYSFYKENEINIGNEPMSLMSKITANILKSINYDDVKIRRQSNFLKLHEALVGHNQMIIQEYKAAVPLSYPFLCNDNSLSKRLIENSIFTASYWPNVTLEAPKESVEYQFSTRLVHLPIDQRYSESDMDRIINVVLK